MDEQEDLIERIYEASIIGDSWLDVINRISLRAGCDGGVLFAAGRDGVRWLASDCIAPFITQSLNDGWMNRNSRLSKALSVDHAGFIVDHDLYTDAELDADPFYAYFRSKGYGWCTGIVLPTPSGDTIVFNWERRFEHGPVARTTAQALDPLRPHLARAAVLSARLNLERARAMTDILGQLGLPAGALSFSRSLIASNAEMDLLIPNVVQDRRARVALKDARADQLLSVALSQPVGSRHPEVQSIPIPGSKRQPPMVAHLVPARRSARDVLAAVSHVLVLTPVDRGTVPGADLIRALFDLTPAEARVARGIAEGATVDTIAKSLSVAPSTIRHQLKAVFQKTGVNRQAELVRLLGGLTLSSMRSSDG